MVNLLTNNKQHNISHQHCDRSSLRFQSECAALCAESSSGTYLRMFDQQKLIEIR
jgi:hypothetical protein